MSEIVRVAGIDPGLRNLGYGIIEYNTEENTVETMGCGYINVPAKHKGMDALMHMTGMCKELAEEEQFTTCDHVVIEVPVAVYYKTYTTSGLIPVAAIAGCLMGLFSRENNIVPVYPSTWNKSKKKEKTHAKIFDTLGHYDEWSYIAKPKSKSTYEHIIDAVGMAYWLIEDNYLE